MADMTIRIIWATKPSGNLHNSHEAISDFGWIIESTGETGRSTRLELYNWLKIPSNHALVRDGSGDVAWVGTRENSNGTQYLQTYADGIWKDNLLELPTSSG